MIFEHFNTKTEKMNTVLHNLSVVRVPARDGRRGGTPGRERDGVTITRDGTGRGTKKFAGAGRDGVRKHLPGRGGTG